MRLRFLLSVTWMTASLAAQPAPQASVPAPRHESNFDEERKQANELYLAGKILESLPLYEDLCRQDQTIAVFAERHGMGLMRKGGTLPDGPEHKALHEQGMAEYRRAQKLGDNSDLVQTVLADQGKSMIGAAISGIPLSVGYTYHGTLAAQRPAEQAEMAFSRQDPATALSLYKQAAVLDPKWYDPVLFAGDMEFRLKEWAAAGEWFARAIAIDPDRDTAYRYWGDALFRSGARDEAKTKYEQGVVAEPYGRTAWIALQNWARATKTPMAHPPIVIPKFSNKNGVLNVDAGLDAAAARASGQDSWRAYQRCRSKQIAANNKFSFSVNLDGSTQPSGAYHTVGDETGCLMATLTDLKAKLASGAVTADALDPGLKALDEIEQAGMLQCWILLDDSDAQDRFDYPAYRKGHRELLVAYIDRFVVHSTPAAQP